MFAAVMMILAACDRADDPTAMANMNPPTMVDPGDSTTLKRGAFVSYEHNLMGAASLHVDSLGAKTIRLEEFTMTQGPDVHVYISKSNNYSKANTIEIGQLTASYSNNAIDFSIDSIAYGDDFKFVLVYCLQYNALFGYAELK